MRFGNSRSAGGDDLVISACARFCGKIGVSRERERERGGGVVKMALFIVWNG